MKHKRIGGNGLWWTLCGKFGLTSTWVNTWKPVTCKHCKALKGTSRDWLTENKNE